jgi:hypothetical protein
VKYWFLLLFLTGCASLTPVDKTPTEVPKSLPPEIQDKFTVSETKIEEVKKNEVVNLKKQNNNKKPKVNKENNSIPVLVKIKQFNPPTNLKLVYAVYAPLGIRAGTLEAKIEGIKFLKNQEVVHLKASIYNAAFFNNIFKVNLLVESFVDPYDFKSLRYQVSGQEGKITKQNLEFYDYEKDQVIEYKSNQSENQQKIYDILTVNVAQDILSAFFKIIYLDFTIKKQHDFFVVSGDKIKQARVVKIKDEVFNNQQVVVVGLAFEPDQDPLKHQIWLNSKTNTILQIKADIKWGNFKVVLENE